MSVKATVISEIQQIADDNKKSLPPLKDDLRESEPVLKQMNPPEGLGTRTALDVFEVAAEARAVETVAEVNAGRGTPQEALRALRRVTQPVSNRRHAIRRRVHRT